MYTHILDECMSAYSTMQGFTACIQVRYTQVNDEAKKFKRNNYLKTTILKASTNLIDAQIATQP